MPLICEGLTVVELGTGVACDLPTMVLADNGARVLKIERPGGDWLRRAMPSAFLVWNRGKESVVLDLATPEGRGRATELVAGADVVVEAFGPGVAERLGLGPDAMRDANPALVYCSIKAFGSTGPYAHLKGYEGIVAAKAGGYMSATFRDGPAFFGMPRASVAAGHYALQGILAALFVRETTGRGQLVETDLLRGLSTYGYYTIASYQLPPTPGHAAGQFNGMLCSADDRWVFPTNRLRKELEALVRAVDLAEVFEDPRFALQGGAGDHPHTATPEDDRALWDLIAGTFRSRSLDEWMPRLNAEDDLAGEWARTCEQALDHPQMLHNGHVVEIDDPRVGRVRQVGPIASFTATPSAIGRPAPALDEHGALPPSPPSKTVVDAGAAAPTHPLTGVTIVELGHHFAMPYVTTLAAALGARVIKAEPPEGDHMRDASAIPEAGGFRVMDGKESIIADARTAEGRAIIYDLVRRADVFALGLRQTAADRMLMNEAVIRAINPDIIYFSSTGYGDSGPFVGKAMHAGTASAAVGSLHYQASSWLDPATAKGLSLDELENVAARFGMGAHIGDAAAAASSASALILAILAKRRFGLGQYVRTTMLVGNAYSFSDDLNTYEGKPPSRLVDPEQLGLSPLYRLYPAASGWVFLAVPRQSEWETFCDVAGLALGDDPRFATAASREANAQALADELTLVFVNQSADAWEAALAPKGVGCVAVYEGSPSVASTYEGPATEFACTNPAVRSTGHVVEVDHPLFGRLLRHGLPHRFSETPGFLGTGCLAGQHTHEVLSELGYTPDRIAQLEADGAITPRRHQGHTE
jgi:crotonobetainyl-CoA:carnitine CoA-transferase CaiB-like acyl-CoA transferase